MLSTAQLCLLRSLLKAGSPADLIGIYLNRCGATEQEWQSLISEKLVETDREGRYWLSKEGKRTYKKAKVGRYF